MQISLDAVRVAGLLHEILDDAAEYYCNDSNKNKTNNNNNMLPPLPSSLPLMVVSNAHDPHQTNCLASWDEEGVVTTALGKTRNSGRASWRESGALY
jgi:hypothetical protein